MVDVNGVTPILTGRQSEIFEFIKSFLTTNGMPPTVRDIGHTFKIRSPNGVLCHLKALEKKGVIERSSRISRGIRVVGGQSRVLAVRSGGIVTHFVIDDTFSPANELAAYKKTDAYKNGGNLATYLMGRGLKIAGRDMVVELSVDGK
jgi:SOS-response transcriptional repressor LexA